MKLLRLLLIILAFSAAAYSQPWVGTIDPTRAIDWSQAGTTIPARSVICATLNPGATSAQINSAIASCPSNQVVYLNPGTYTLSEGIDLSQNSNVTVRGAGANKTFLVFTGSVPGTCNGISSDVCIAGSNAPGTVADWTAGYAARTTSITLSTSTGITAGSTLLNLDQLDETTDTGNIWNCLATGVCANEGSSGLARDDNRSQQQQVMVTACSPSCNNAGPTIVTISPGVYLPNWRASQSPQAWWEPSTLTQDGIEDVSLDHTISAGSDGVFSGIFIQDCYKCWVKGVRSLYSGRNHVWLYQSSHSVVRDSYFYQSVSHSSESYGVEIAPYSSDNLVENNIFDSVTDSNPSSTAGGAGNVAGYNFTVQTLFTNAPGWFQASDYEHASGSGFWLREGNQATGFTADGIHGTHQLTTMFRNY